MDPGVSLFCPRTDLISRYISLQWPSFSLVPFISTFPVYNIKVLFIRQPYINILLFFVIMRKLPLSYSIVIDFIIIFNSRDLKKATLNNAKISQSRYYTYEMRLLQPEDGIVMTTSTSI